MVLECGVDVLCVLLKFIAHGVVSAFIIPPCFHSLPFVDMSVYGVEQAFDCFADSRFLQVQ